MASMVLCRVLLIKLYILIDAIIEFVQRFYGIANEATTHRILKGLTE